ncbi:nischarin-like isoform X2 [Ptychodera flava]|uniref:nischarin-like isoform X2 n=1 Tax=Ptychodera flava TaxID=63121 RepID=UPI00396A8100
MASYSDDLDDIRLGRKVSISGTEQVDNYTVYIIEVSVNDSRWRVRHRYSEFSELHERLVTENKIERSLLPPKKLLGNLSKSFIEKRQKDLEQYLQVLLQKYTYLPKPLSVFLGFNIYDIHGVTEALAEELFERGDMILAAGEVYHMTPMQLYAITERLKLAIPTCESGDRRLDLGHVMDFIAMLKYLKITGFEKSLGTSSRTVNELPYDMSIFKALVQVQIDNCNCRLISGLDSLKRTLATLNVHQSTTTIRDLLLPSAHQWETGTSEFTAIVPTWSVLTTADFSHNTIESIDESVKLMPKVEYLDLSHNLISSVEHLQHLSSLTHVDLSHNRIQSVQSINTKLGNIKSLNLSANQLDSLLGLAKLYSLSELDVSHNKITDVVEIKHLCGLPCLERLILLGNPVTIVTDYRTKILEIFGDRASEVTLDKQATSQKELDTVAVLQAIHKAKEAKEKQRKKVSPRKKHVHEAEIADADSLESESLQQANLHGTPGSSPTATGPVTEPNPTSGEFRSQIESIRNLGGEQWLRMLNEIQQSGEERSSLSSNSSLPHDSKSLNLKTEGSPQGQGSSRMGQRPDESVAEEVVPKVIARSPDFTSDKPSTDDDPSKEPAPSIEGLSPSLQHLQCVLESISKHSKADEFPMEDLLLTRIPIPPGEYYDNKCDNDDDGGEDDGERRQPPEGESDTSEAETSMEESDHGIKEQTQSLQHYVDNMPVNQMKEFLQCLVELSDDGDPTLGGMPVKIAVAGKFQVYLEKRLHTLMPGALFEVMTTAREKKSSQSTVRVVFKSGSLENIRDTDLELHLPTSPVTAVPQSQSQPSVDPARMYSEDVLDDLSQQNSKVNSRLSDALCGLAALRGVAIVKYFHENIAQISADVEELKFLMWCDVITHALPSQEVESCVMLSSKAIYFVSDQDVKLLKKHSSGLLQSWKGHRRMYSDSIVGSSKAPSDNLEATSHCSGVIMNVSPDSSQGQVKCYHIMQLKNLKEVFSGLFDQSFRLTGTDSDNTLSCITRDYRLTHAFLDVLMSVLCFINIATPSPEMESSGSEYDLYKASLKAWSCRENFEYVHPSKVRFIYPSEEVVNDLTFIVVDSIKENKPKLDDVTILMYSLLFQLRVAPCESKDTADKTATAVSESRTMVVTSTHIVLCIQDHVSYPLPDYTKVLPENPQYRVTDVKPLSDLRRLAISDPSQSVISLAFEKTEVVVDVSRDYYSAQDSPADEVTEAQEILWTFLLQTMEERDRLQKLLSKQWMNLTGRELPVHSSI